MAPKQTRRGFVGMVATAVATTGCIGGDSADYEPIALDDGSVCDYCGMVIEDHPGPVGLTFYSDALDSDGPARFCSVLDMYQHEYEEVADPTVEARFVTDYSAVDYEIDDESYISAHLAAEDFASVGSVVYAVETGIRGAMGPAMVSFSSTQDAESFAQERGGDTVQPDAVTQQTVEALSSMGE